MDRMNILIYTLGWAGSSGLSATEVVKAAEAFEKYVNTKPPAKKKR